MLTLVDDSLINLEYLGRLTRSVSFFLGHEKAAEWAAA